jgi:hypothetical protein
MVDDREQRRPVLVFLGLMAASLAGLLLLPPIPQDQSYHHFADQRTLLGVPNFWNVISNLPFIAVGAAGLRRFHRDPATFVIFLGIFLTGFGSSYYHWNPSDSTLFWDRLPMTLCFMAILAVVVEERISARLGATLLWPLLATGLLSLLLWRSTGDLRLYGWVQFPSWHCRCCFGYSRRNIPARSIGSSPGCFTRSPNCSSSTTTRSIRISC